MNGQWIFFGILAMAVGPFAAIPRERRQARPLPRSRRLNAAVIGAVALAMPTCLLGMAWLFYLIVAAALVVILGRRYRKARSAHQEAPEEAGR